MYLEKIFGEIVMCVLFSTIILPLENYHISSVQVRASTPNLATFSLCVSILNERCKKLLDHTVKVKLNYFIVRPKVDQRAGLLSLPHLGNFRCTATFTTSAFRPTS